MKESMESLDCLTGIMILVVLIGYVMTNAITRLDNNMIYLEGLSYLFNMDFLEINMVWTTVRANLSYIGYIDFGTLIFACSISF